MKDRWIINLTGILLLLSACAPEAEIGHVEDETELIIFSEDTDASISLSALMSNQSERPAEDLTINWEVTGEEVLDLFSEPELLTESEGESFSIGGGERFMVSETYLLEETPEHPEEFSGAIDGVITNADGEEVYRFTFEHIEDIQGADG